MLRDSPRIGPGTVIYIEQRPVAPFRHEAMIRNAYEGLLALGGGQVPPDLPTAFIADTQLRHTIEKGLERGHFRDTTHVGDWIDHMNRVFGHFGDYGIPPLHLKVVHAETDIDLLKRVMVEQGFHPAGVFLSGSPKMVPDTILSDPAVMKTAEVCRYLLEKEIPLLGICFGFQLLGHVRWGAMVEWLTNPPGMGLRVLQDKPTRRFQPIIPGARQGNFGAYRIEWNKGARQVPMLRNAGHLRGLKVHSMYFPFPHRVIPEGAVLATSARRFKRDRNAPAHTESVERVIEMLQYGAAAFGTQLHPELTPEFLLALTYIPAVERGLRDEGHDIAFIRETLQPMKADGWPAQRFGYNFTKYYLVAGYLERLLREQTWPPATEAHIRRLQADLRTKGDQMHGVPIAANT